MSVQLTEIAAQEIKRVIEQEQLPDSTVLRVGVAGGGCSGFEYKLGFENLDTVDEEADTVHEVHGVQVVVDKKSSLYLDGTEIDYHSGIEKRGFVFNNPNATKSCGCGSSFQA